MEVYITYFIYIIQCTCTCTSLLNNYVAAIKCYIFFIVDTYVGFKCFFLSIFLSGVAKAEAGNFSEAIRLFSRVLQLDPNHEAAKRHLEQAKAQLTSLNSASNGNGNRRNNAMR